MNEPPSRTCARCGETLDADRLSVGGRGFCDSVCVERWRLHGPTLSAQAVGHVPVKVLDPQAVVEGVGPTPGPDRVVSAAPPAPLCESCQSLAATLVVKASGKRICGLCAPLDGRKVRLLMVGEPQTPAKQPTDNAH